MAAMCKMTRMNVQHVRFLTRMSKPAGVQTFLDKHHRTERVQCCHFIRLMIMKHDDDIICNGQKGGLKYLPHVKWSQQRGNGMSAHASLKQRVICHIP